MPAKLVQRRRGTTANHSVFAGAEGEITQDTTKNTLVSHDGNTQGGHPLAKEDMSNVVGTASGGGVGIVQLNLSDGGNGQVLTTDGSGNMSFQSIDVNNDMQLGGDLSGSISNAQIITNAVGLTELNVTAPSTGGQLLSADGSGNLQFITPASNMTLSGDVSGNLANTQIVAQAVGTPELATNAVTTVKISDLNVTSGKIADGSITSNKIAGLSVTTDKITDGNITLAKMADNSVRTGNIIDANVTTAKLASLSVDGTKIAAGAVTSTKIAAGAVDGTKIANNAVGVTQLSVQADGAAGEFLQTNGSGVLSFATAASTLTGGGGTSLVSIQTFGSVVSANGTGNGISGPNITTHTWTKPAGVTRVLYFVTGGGGGDGIFSHNGDGTQANPAQAIIRGYGGGGGTVMGFLDVTNIVSETVTVGSCGGNFLGNALNSPGNPSGLSNGSAGEASTFGTHATAFGGGGGLSGVNGGSGVNPNDTTAFAAGNPGGGGGTGGSVQMRGSASSAGPTPGTSFWGETPGGGNGNINRANQGGSGIVVILEFA